MTPTVWQVLAGLAMALLAVYAVLLVALLRARPHGVSLTDAARLLPDVLRLLRRLSADGAVPRGVRVRLWLLLVYLALPVDLVPDVVPVLGYADDVLVTLLVLRAVVRRAGASVLERHWPGTPEGLAAVLRLADRPPRRRALAPTPPHGPALLAIAAGGAIGGTARYLAALALPEGTSLPWATVVVNVTGAFLLGLLLVVLPLRAPDRLSLRLFATTGVLGSLTTFSTWMVEANALVLDGAVLAAVLLLVGTLLAGLLAVAGGVLIGRQLTPARAR